LGQLRRQLYLWVNIPVAVTVVTTNEREIVLKFFGRRKNRWQSGNGINATMVRNCKIMDEETRGRTLLDR